MHSLLMSNTEDLPEEWNEMTPAERSRYFDAMRDEQDRDYEAAYGRAPEVES